MNSENVMPFIEKGEGFPVLLGHSYLFDRDMWSPQIDVLAKRYRVIAPNLWGHGDASALPSTVGNLQDLARDNLKLMDSLGIDKFAVVGLSVGGMWGAELAAIAPERVSALVLMDTYLGSETAEEKQKYFQMLDAVGAAGAIVSPLLEYVVAQFYSQYASQEDIGKLKQSLSALPATTLRESIVPVGKMIFGRPDRMAILDSITCPCHVATGELDLPRPPREGQEMAQRLGCEFTAIPQAGHISNREKPDVVNAMLLNFLAKHLPAN